MGGEEIYIFVYSNVKYKKRYIPKEERTNVA